LGRWHLHARHMLVLRRGGRGLHGERKRARASKKARLH